MGNFRAALVASDNFSLFTALSLKVTGDKLSSGFFEYSMYLGVMNKGVIFVRVSKREQDYKRQIEDLRTVAQSQNLPIVAEIAEKVSGATLNGQRDGLQELLALARNGEINKVLVQEVSRLGRSTVEVLQVLEELTSLQVSVYVQNFGIETLKNGRRNPIAQFMFTLLAEFARLERETLLAEFARLERETLRERILSGETSPLRAPGIMARTKRHSAP